MTDIVERLRNFSDVQALPEAADEIERLLAVIKQLQSTILDTIIVQGTIRAATIEECARLVEDVGYSRDDAVQAIRALATEGK